MRLLLTSIELLYHSFKFELVLLSEHALLVLAPQVSLDLFEPGEDTVEAFLGFLAVLHHFFVQEALLSGCEGQL